MTSSQHSERCVTPSSYLRNVLKTVGGGAPEKQTSGLARRFCSKRSLHLRGQSSVFTQEITQPDVHESAVQRELLHAGRRAVQPAAQRILQGIGQMATTLSAAVHRRP